jgi:hypothetical protein
MITLMLAGDLNASDNRSSSYISRAVDNIPEDNQIIIITNNQELVDTQISSSQIEVICVPNVTSGALATLAFGLSRIPDNTPFLVVPSNSILPKSEISRFMAEMKLSNSLVGAIAFEGDNPLYSYARLDSSGRVIEVIEKQVSGSCALAGTFFFEDKKLLMDCTKWAMVNNAHTGGKFFVAPSLNYFVVMSPILRAKIELLMSF